MPLIRITYPRGALTQEQKRQIATTLTEIVLDVEVDAVTDAGRMITVVHFNEAEPEDWAVAGQIRAGAADPPNHFIVDLIVLEGLLDGARRSQAHARVTEAFQKAFGRRSRAEGAGRLQSSEEGDSMLPLRVWVLVHDVREGGWGAGGQTVSALDVARFINSDLEEDRRTEIAASLARASRGRT